MDIYKLIEDQYDTGYWQQNPFIEFAARVVELVNVNVSVEPLRSLYDRMILTHRKRPGIFLRAPWGQPNSWMATSHDELIGIVILSNIFDNSQVTKEIVNNLALGLWITGKNEKGKAVDGEWFVYWRPDYRGFVKIAQGKQLSLLERAGVEINLLTSTSWNMKRARILFLKHIGYKDCKPSWLTRIICKLAKKHIYSDRYVVEQSEAFMMDSYKGRYGNEPILNYIWSLTSN